MKAAMMMLSEAAAMLGVAFSGVDAEVLRVCTDSRSIAAGDLFIALRGAKFDGGAYAAQALQQGAVGVVLDARQAPDVTSAIRVDDTRLALGKLAAAWRNRFTLPLVAITGSNGKTTVKEMLAAILQSATSAENRLGAAGADAAVLATEGNLNNDIGLPLMLLRLREAYRYAVMEMGMNHVGEIDYLTRLARPDVALINNAQAAHVGMLGSVAAIAQAKGEIFNGLGEQGVAVINSDDGHAELWREANRGRRVLSFGLAAQADVRGEFELLAYGGKLAIITADARIDVSLHVPGEHNARNALAAAAAALALDIAPAHIAAGLSGFTGVKGRLMRLPALHGSTFIDDTYNANPDSVRAALSVLAAQPGKKILVLGDMGELGSDAAALHAQMGLAARQAGVEKLFALGDLSRETVGAFGAGAMHFERIQELLADLENELAADTTVLVKGSRFMQMERVVQSFVEAP
ncbi:MAG: UDP-N-acetylmuramoyl-tripeptide--D-alanyl-D-alanine ligase [Thiobacillaceae bacterium]